VGRDPGRDRGFERRRKADERRAAHVSGAAPRQVQTAARNRVLGFAAAKNRHGQDRQTRIARRLLARDGETGPRVAWLCRILNLDRETLPERPEGGLDLIESRRVLEIE